MVVKSIDELDAMKDYRRMLYRLDLATSFKSTDALLLHFMDETPLDGFIEIRVHSVYPTSDASVDVSPTPSARLSFYRETPTGQVIADRLFEPAKSTSEKDAGLLYRQRYIVAKRFPPGTLLSNAFNHIINPLLRGKSGVYRSLPLLSFNSHPHLQVIVQLWCSNTGLSCFNRIQRRRIHLMSLRL